MKTLKPMGITIAALAVLAAGAGCPYTFKTGMPDHIKTVSIEGFRNRTFYKKIDNKLTEALVRKFNESGSMTVVNNGSDARLTGEVVDVQQIVMRENKLDRPASKRYVITVRISFYDQVEQKYLVQDLELSSQQSSSSTGLYNLDAGQTQETAEEAAVDELASEILRRLIYRF